jgi:DNA polymerase-3 subunit epsilon
LCRKYSIDLSRRTKHNAMLDCELLREVYINLLGAREPKLNLSSSALNKPNSFDSIKPYNKKILKISEIEIKKHKEFLKSKIKKNFY